MDVCESKPQPSYFAIIVTSVLLWFTLIGTSKLGDYYTVKNNWGEYRCQIEIMLFASFFGHDTMENLQFCLSSGFNNRASTAISPFYGIMSGFTQVLTTFLESINSIRITFATLVGSISQVFSEFSQRVQQLMYRIQASALRLKFLMNRVFGTMYSLVFMGMSGLKAVDNFSNTTIYKFMNFMACFPPETPLVLQDKGTVQMKDVVIGDVFANTPIRVTGTVQILGDGQQMIAMNGCSVSATHYVEEDGRWILSKDSRKGKPAEVWKGGIDRPLTCLVTSSHTLPIGNILFSDYHETEDADRSTMNTILRRLNGGVENRHAHSNYITGVDPSTDILLEDGTYCPAHSLRLGMRLRHGIVMAIITRECSTFTEYNGERFGYATAIWKKKAWLRGEDVLIEKGLCINFAVYPSAIIETRANVIRDMFELHELNIETDYANAMEKREMRSDYVLK
jgi:hypothetical protein